MERAPFGAVSLTSGKNASCDEHDRKKPDGVMSKFHQ